MGERKFVEVSLNGQTFKIYDGYTMAVLEAQTESGGIPSDEDLKLWTGKDATPNDQAKFACYTGRFVQAYFKLVPDFFAACTVPEVIQAFNAIMEATTRDPFGQLPQTPPSQSEPSPTSGNSPT